MFINQHHFVEHICQWEQTMCDPLCKNSLIIRVNKAAFCREGHKIIMIIKRYNLGRFSGFVLYSRFLGCICIRIICFSFQNVDPYDHFIAFPSLKLNHSVSQFPSTYPTLLDALSCSAAHQFSMSWHVMPHTQ